MYIGNLSRKGALKNLQEGNLKGLFWFFKEYFAKMAYFAIAIIGSKKQSEEIITQVFVNLWKKRKTIATEQDINMFLYYETRNECYKFLQETNNLQIGQGHRYSDDTVSKLLEFMEFIEIKKKKDVVKIIFSIEFKNELVEFGAPITKLYDPKYRLNAYKISNSRSPNIKTS